MKDLRFTAADINRRLFNGDIGDAFQAFIYDLLSPEYAARGLRLTRFPAGGKDGGIDLVADGQNWKEVLECKVCGGDSPSQVRSAWLRTAATLARNLQDQNGPKTGQSQYSPWYSTSNPIRAYVLCTTFKPSNDSQRDDLSSLRSDIQTFFAGLARDHEHLRHLESLEVGEILDWTMIETKIRARKHLLFRWFPGLRVIGLTPFEEAVESENSYRAYLQSTRLPFYSQTTHALKVPPPPGLDVADPSALLAGLTPGLRDGLIVSGPGGVGKTRLTLEIAQLAARDEWSVFRAGSRLTPERIEELAESLDPDDRVLIVFDYVETERDFSGLLEAIHNVVDSRGLRIGYVASSRSAFYRTTLAIDSRHEHVDISLLAEAQAQQWLKGYLEAAVVHVLEQAFEYVEPAHQIMCGRVPALAVFLVYLQASGRNQDLNELAEDRDFARWVNRRLGMTFPDREVSLDVAVLSAILPLPADSVGELGTDRGRILDRLLEDGWVEFADEGGDSRYTAIHDVLADEVLLHHLSSAHASRGVFLDHLFDEAIRLNALESLLLCLERIADVSVMHNVELISHIERSMDKAPASWRRVVTIVLRMSGITTADKIALHQKFTNAWEGSGLSIGVQNALGWIARSVIKSGAQGLTVEILAELVDWIKDTIPRITSSNFLVTWGLRLAPEQFREAALSWILAKPRVFQSHYVCVAWLECQLPTDPIELAVIQWTEAHARSLQFSFLVRAWLERGGRPAVLRHGIELWLLDHGEKEVAQFVYRGWLDSTGDRPLVEEGIRKWLIEHDEKEVAQFVYKGWLDAAGDRALVEEGIRKWLDEHSTTEGARFVYKAWLDATGDRTLVEEGIGKWLEEHSKTEDARFVYKAWLDAAGDRAFVEGGIGKWLEEHRKTEGARFVYKAWLDAAGDRALVEEGMRAWLIENSALEVARFVYSAWLEAMKDFALVESGVKSWLLQFPDHDEVDYVVRAWVDADGPFGVVRDAAFRWLHTHAEEERAVYVTKCIALLPDLPTEAIADVLRWCAAHPSNEDAIWRLSQLRWNLQDLRLGGTTVRTASLVIGELLGYETMSLATSINVVSVLRNLVDNPAAQSGSPRGAADAIFMRWLRHPTALLTVMRSAKSIQQSALLRRLIELLESKQLSIDTDREHIERFLNWADSWSLDYKRYLVSLLRSAAANFPCARLWQTVRVEGAWPEPEEPGSSVEVPAIA